MKKGTLLLITGCAALAGLLFGRVMTKPDQHAAPGYAVVPPAGEVCPEGDTRAECAPPPRDTASFRQPPPRPAPQAAAPQDSGAQIACGPGHGDPPAAPAARPPAPQAAAQRQDPSERRQVQIGPEDPVRGPASAKVTIVAFMDFQCPFSVRGAKTMEEVLSAYGSDVRLVSKHFPLAFHRDAPLAHQASIEAHRQGRYWEYQDRLLGNIRALKRGDLEAHARALGLDMSRFNRALDENVHIAKVQSDIAQGRMLGVTGTPAFFVNGRFVSGARPFEYFKRIIDEERGI